jgi:hypothetical protein
VPTKKPKFLADTREKIRRLKKQRSQVRETPAAAAGQRRNKTNKERKNTHSKHTAHRNQTTSLEWPPVSNYQLAGQPRADPHTHESNGGDHAKETRRQFRQKRLFLFPLVPFSSKAKRAKHTATWLSLSLSLSREMMRDFFGFEAGQE